MNLSNPRNHPPHYSQKVGENLFVKIILDVVLLLCVIVLLITIVAAIKWTWESRQTEAHHHVTVKFVGGNKTKLVLNAEQYDQLKNVLNQKDGFFEIGDDLDNVKIYREHVCAVEVKKK